MQALAAGRLAERLQSEVLEPVAYVLGRLDHLGEIDVRRRVEIEHQPARRVRLVGRTIPWMQFEPRDLRDRGQTLDAVDLQIGLAVAGDFYRFQQIGHALHGMALKETLAME